MVIIWFLCLEIFICCLSNSLFHYAVVIVLYPLCPFCFNNVQVHAIVGWIGPKVTKISVEEIELSWFLLDGVKLP